MGNFKTIFDRYFYMSLKPPSFFIYYLSVYFAALTISTIISISFVIWNNVLIVPINILQNIYVA